MKEKEPRRLPLPVHDICVGKRRELDPAQTRGRHQCSGAAAPPREQLTRLRFRTFTPSGRRSAPYLKESSHDVYKRCRAARRRAEPYEVSWSPDQPRIRKPRPQRKFLAAYQAARREFFEEVAAVFGGGVLILDTDLKKICGHEVIVPPTQH
jgi:hypothetical protein